MIHTIKNYFSLVKFSHTIFALPFALIGFFLALASVGYAPAKPAWQLFLLVIACMVFARSAAMAYNRWLDKNIDALNPRTAVREIPSGLITARNALLFVAINCILFITATWFINRICFYLSPLALFVILFYSYTKRFTLLCHLVLGLGLSLAPLGAWLAVTGSFNWLPLFFSCAVICWVSGFDIIYALQDEEFDKAHRLYSIPSSLGKVKALHVSELLHVCSAGFIIAAGSQGNFGWLYWCGAAVFTAMLIFQHSIVKPGDLSRVNLAFMTTNGIASVIFCIFVLADLFILQTN